MAKTFVDGNSLAAPGAVQMTAWTLKLASHDYFGSILTFDPHLFALFYAACGVAVDPPAALVPEAPPSSSDANDKFLAALKDLQRQYDERTTGQFTRLYLNGITLHGEITKDRNSFNAAFEQWQEDAAAEVSQYVTSQDRNITQISKLLGLTAEESDLLVFQLNRHRVGFSHLYDLLMRGEELAVEMFAIMFDSSSGKIRNALSETAALVRSGLLAVQHRPLKIDSPSAHLRIVLTESADSDEEFMRRFVKPLKPAPSTASLARLDDHDRDILMSLMSLPLNDDHGLHALVYGPASVDKRDLLARIFEAEDVPAYVVVTKEVPPSDMPFWVYVSQSYLAEHEPRAVLVIDRADQALSARRVSMMTMFGLAEDDSIDDDGRSSDDGLTDNRIRCVWITDRARHLSERNLGRFLFHCEARPGSRADRRERVAKVVTDFGLSEGLERELAKYSLLGEHQVRQAATLANLLHTDTAGDERETVIRRAVLQSQRALGRDAIEELRDSVTKYSLDNLNLKGSFTAEQIVGALKKRRRGTVCLYGLPGAGKTQLAEYLAVELDLPIIRRSASDLLSKWVGENEQNLAAMFAEAEAEGALLFLDEADSFLRDRALARAEWSVTQVNEILQQMERFDGIFVAATNLMSEVDAAALRRFTFKLEFLPLTPEQSWNMFVTETGYDADSADSAEVEAMQQELWAIKNLTPGDFATVKRQSDILEEELTPSEWIAQLDMEAKAKMKGLERNKVGFAD